MARFLHYMKNALTNPVYYPTYAAYSTAAFLAAIYFCDWKYVGKYIPIWGKKFEPECKKELAVTEE